MCCSHAYYRALILDKKNSFLKSDKKMAESFWDLGNFCDFSRSYSGIPRKCDFLGEIFAELQQTVGALKQYQPTTIPAEGLNLNDSEVANVTA